MSMITCFARLNHAQLEKLKSTPGGLENIRSLNGYELIDVDKAAEVISWLLSPSKRADQVYFAALINDPLSPPTPANVPLDDYAIAIEGRGPNGVAALENAYGPPCVFEPEEVKRFSDLLKTVDATVLRRELNFKVMDTMCLPVEYWEEEGEATFTQYIVPQFEKLKRFYQDAANAGQLILVWTE